MSKFKRFFISRKTILALIFLILGAVVIAYFFPQRFATSPYELEKWREAHPSWVPWAERLGLDHVYSTPWFAGLLFLFCLSLGFSSYEQIKVSLKRTFGEGPASGGRNLAVKGGEEEILASVKKQGYLRVAGGETFTRLVKHPWGYWGNVLLHLGIVIVITSSLLLVLSEKRGLLNLVEGEVYFPGSPWFDEERGLMAANFVLPEAVRLDRVIPEFWETDDLKQLTTEIGFIDPQGRMKTQVLAINQTLSYKGLRVYQGRNFGEAFFVEINDEKGKRTGFILQIPKPSRRNQAGYGNFQFEGIPYLLKAKYFADAEKKSMDSFDPLLIMRLVGKSKEVVGEISLRTGEYGPLGPYTVHLVKVSRWAGIIFVDVTGMPGIFLGFFIIVLGGGLTYFFPPREFLVRKEDEGFSLTWKAARFEEFYKGEYESVVNVLSNKSTA